MIRIIKDGRDSRERPNQANGMASGHSTKDDVSFETIFLQSYAHVVTLLFRLLGDRAQAEDLANEVFIKLYKKPLPPHQNHNVQGWLYRTAMHLGIDALRAGTRRQRYERAAAYRALESKTPGSPLDEVLRTERQRRVRDTLARLKPAQAQILILKSSGLSHKELAQVLGIKTNSIGKLLARAEVAFEKCYRKRHGDKED